MEATGARDDPSTAGESKPRSRTGTHSGRLLLRMPETLHAELARVSEREGVSLNQLINDLLSSAIGWRREGGAPPSDSAKSTAAAPATPSPRAAPATAPEASRGRSPTVSRLLVANLVVVAAVGVLAIVLIVEALR